VPDVTVRNAALETTFHAHVGPVAIVNAVAPEVAPTLTTDDDTANVQEALGPVGAEGVAPPPHDSAISSAMATKTTRDAEGNRKCMACPVKGLAMNPLECGRSGKGCCYRISLRR
jgi:hypothetical protein